MSALSNHSEPFLLPDSPDIFPYKTFRKNISIGWSNGV